MISSAALSALSPGGALSRAFPDYEDRPQQRRMAEAVLAALEDRRPLLVEAGTGTGKTLAYLLPAIASGQRVVISTGTRALQEQLFGHDIPLLRDLLDTPIEAVALKGVSNYLCQRRYREWSAQLTLDGWNAEEGDRHRRALLEWARSTDSGDRAELDSLPENAPLWRSVTVTPETRLAARCPQYDRCFVTRARRAADKAQLVVVNHHLFFADLSLRSAFPRARVLPDYDAVIFDEAHQLEDVITEHFGVSVSTHGLGRLAADCRTAAMAVTRDPTTPLDRMVDHLEAKSQQLFEAVRRELVSIAADDDRATPRPGPETDAPRVELPRELFSEHALQDAWFGLDNALHEIAAHTGRVAEQLDDDDRAETLSGLSRRARAQQTALAEVAEMSSERFVYWGHVRGRDGVSLFGSPVDVSHIVRRELVDVTSSIVFTSATLTTSGRFEFARQRLGLAGDDADELRVDSPFDYATQALLYLPRDLPDPRDEGFTAACCDRIEELLAITAGRAFVLFTSHRALRQATERLRGRLPWNVLIQGQAPKQTLLATFRASRDSVLFGTGSFWEGVDVPGDALSQVIINRLPFAPPGDPLVRARMRRIEAQGGEPFSDYQLPQAALALKQGIGRLIRRRGDRGIAAVLDPRVLGKRYGRAFIASLPEGIPRTAALEQVRRWWRQ